MILQCEETCWFTDGGCKTNNNQLTTNNKNSYYWITKKTLHESFFGMHFLLYAICYMFYDLCAWFVTRKFFLNLSFLFLGDDAF